MLRCLLTPVVFAGLVIASCQLSGCVIVVDADADSDLECLDDDHDGTPRMGIGISHVDKALAQQLNINADRATLVTSVNQGSPAERGGVHQFDVITRVDGSDDASIGAVQNAVRAKKPGETITLTVIRNGQPIDLAVTI